MIKTLAVLLLAVAAIGTTTSSAEDAPCPKPMNAAASSIWMDENGVVHGPFVTCHQITFIPMVGSD